jgi:hypothetical protein
MWQLLLLMMPLVYANSSVTRRVWRKRRYKTSRKIKLTLAMWLLPGSFLLISNSLRDSPPAIRMHGIDHQVDRQIAAFIGSTDDHSRQ